MPAFLIPLAGLALGALGQLFKQQRSRNALNDANATASANSPSETGLSTAATGSNKTSASERLIQKPPTGTQTSGSGTIGRSEADALVEKFRRGPASNSTQNGGDPVSATQPATGPVQQNSGSDSPTPATGQDAGLGARLGAASIAASRKKNKDQKNQVSNAALS